MDAGGTLASACLERFGADITEAALTEEERTLLAKIADATDRRIRGLAFYWRSRLTGDLTELRAFLDALQGYSPVSPGQPDSEQSYIASDIAATSVSMLTYAWLQHGPIEAARDEYIEQAVRCAADKDEVFRVSCAALLQAIRDNPGSVPFPPEAESVLQALLKNEIVAMIAPRQISAIREEIEAMKQPPR